jgi:hypothetical protein
MRWPGQFAENVLLLLRVQHDRAAAFGTVELEIHSFPFPNISGGACAVRAPHWRTLEPCGFARPHGETAQFQCGFPIPRKSASAFGVAGMSRLWEARFVRVGRGFPEVPPFSGPSRTNSKSFICPCTCDGARAG